MSIHVKGTLLNGVPVYLVNGKETPNTAIKGTFLPNGQLAFPAYHPLSQSVLKGFADSSLDETAKKYADEAYRIEQTIANSLKTYESGAASELSLPEGFEFFVKPFRHQELGIELGTAALRLWMLWEMGTGKTKVGIETFRYLKALGKSWRMLVICPSIVLSSWEDEVKFHSKGTLRSITLEGTPEQRNKAIQAANDYDVVLVSYSTVRVEAQAAINRLLPEDLRVKGPFSEAAFDAALETLSKRNLAAFGQITKLMREQPPQSYISQLIDYDFILADEGHNLGNPRSLQTRAVLQLSVKAPRRMILTGTAGDQPAKIYGQMQFLAPALEQRSYSKFLEDHFQFEGGKVVRYTKLDRLNSKVRMLASWMKKKDCLDLPDVTYVDLAFGIGPRQKTLYNSLIEDMRTSLGQETVVFSSMGVIVQKLLQVLSGFIIIPPNRDKGETERTVVRDFENPKLALFESTLLSVLESDDTNKVICWGTFLPELDDMEEVCVRNDIPYVRVDGSTTHKIRELKARFQEADARVYIGQVASGVGVNLTAANYSIYYALPWDRVQYKQSLDRNNRPGQTRNMTVFRLLCANTLDAFVAYALTRKDHIAYTLTEKILCAQCPQQLECKHTNVAPFEEGCLYHKTEHRPIARLKVLK